MKFVVHGLKSSFALPHGSLHLPNAALIWMPPPSSCWAAVCVSLNCWNKANTVKKNFTMMINNEYYDENELPFDQNETIFFGCKLSENSTIMFIFIISAYFNFNFCQQFQWPLKSRSPSSTVVFEVIWTNSIHPRSPLSRRNSYNTSRLLTQMFWPLLLRTERSLMRRMPSWRKSLPSF